MRKLGVCTRNWWRSLALVIPQKATRLCLVGPKASIESSSHGTKILLCTFKSHPLTILQIYSAYNQLPHTTLIKGERCLLETLATEVASSEDSTFYWKDVSEQIESYSTLAIILWKWSPDFSLLITNLLCTSESLTFSYQLNEIDLLLCIVCNAVHYVHYAADTGINFFLLKIHACNLKLKYSMVGI